jgi:hypothetical protein
MRKTLFFVTVANPAFVFILAPAQAGNVSPNIGFALFDCALVASSWMTSQYSARRPSESLERLDQEGPILLLGCIHRVLQTIDTVSNYVHVQRIH